MIHLLVIHAAKFSTPTVYGMSAEVNMSVQSACGTYLCMIIDICATSKGIVTGHYLNLILLVVIIVLGY